MTSTQPPTESRHKPEWLRRDLNYGILSLPRLQTKDYYKILGLSPSANAKEIKSAYRRLAHQFHPDKNHNDLYAASQFEMIKEAYEVLTDPSRKEFYLQQRWYDQVMNKKQTTTVVTPVSVLKQFLELDKYVSQLDTYRMDKEGLYNFISGVLTTETVKKLNAFNEIDINTSIVDSVMKSGRVLPWQYVKRISGILVQIKTDPITQDKIRYFVVHARRSHNWNKYHVWIMLVIVLLACYLIYRLSL